MPFLSLGTTIRLYCNCSIILGTTIYLSVTSLSSWWPLATSLSLICYPWDQHPPVRSCSIILWTISCLSVAARSAWRQLSTALSLFCHTEDTTHLFVTVLLSRGTPNSIWLFAHPRDHYLPLRNFSIVMGTTIHLP